MDGRSNAKQPSSSAQIQEQIPPLNLKRSSWEDIRIVTADGKFNAHEMEYSLADSESTKEAAIDAELMRSRQMRPEDAVAAAMAAIAEAEEAEKVAAEAKRAAEEAQSVVEGLKRRLEEMKARPGRKYRVQSLTSSLRDFPASLARANCKVFLTRSFDDL